MIAETTQTGQPTLPALPTAEPPNRPEGPDEIFVSSENIASEAFSLAKQNLENELRGDARASAWLRECSSTSLDELVKTVHQAETKYSESSKAKNKIVCFVRGLSSRIMLYGKVFDTMAQHHPEYLALVWGLTKFILMGVINHAKLVEHFSQALSTIADVLPTVEISADLYRTERMKNAVANLYSHILLFLRQAVKWYQMGPAGRALTALFNPFELKYKDTVERIRACAQWIDEIADIYVKVETREIHEITGRVHKQGEMIVELQRRFTQGQAELNGQVGTILQIISRDTTKLHEVHIGIKTMQPLLMDTHFKQVLDSIRAPKDNLQKHRSLIRRALPWRNNRINHNTIQLLRIVGEWISAPTSSLVILQTQPRAHSRVKEIATELIGLLQPRDNPVLWYLSSFGDDESRSNGQATTLGLVKSLTLQAMKANPAFVMADPGNFNVAKFNAQHPLAEWIGLLSHILKGTRNCFIILEAEDVFKNEEETQNLDQLFATLFDIIQGTESLVKVLMVNYWRKFRPVGGSGDRNRVTMVDVEREAPLPPRLRKAGNRSVFGNRVGRG